MKALFGAAFVLMMAGLSMAEPRYDRKLEEAVMAIVASKVGDIRGGFALGVKPVMIVVQDDVLHATTDTPSPRRGLPEGMARAVERSPTAYPAGAVR